MPGNRHKITDTFTVIRVCYSALLHETADVFPEQGKLGSAIWEWINMKALQFTEVGRSEIVEVLKQSFQMCKRMGQVILIASYYVMILWFIPGYEQVSDAEKRLIFQVGRYTELELYG